MDICFVVEKMNSMERWIVHKQFDQLIQARRERVSMMARDSEECVRIVQVIRSIVITPSDPVE